MAITALLVTLAGCGDDTSPSAREDPTGAAGERITSQGVAALVEEHLGADRVRWYGAFDEEGQVLVTVRLEDASGPHSFVVGASSPDSDEYGFLGDDVTCDQMEAQEGRRGMEVWCQALEGGGIATVQRLPTGFTDGNRHGRMMMAFAYQPGGRTATAMYESSTPTTDIEPETLLELVADERLAWTTDPAVNDAGSDIEVRRLEG